MWIYSCFCLVFPNICYVFTSVISSQRIQEGIKRLLRPGPRLHLHISSKANVGISFFLSKKKPINFLGRINSGVRGCCLWIVSPVLSLPENKNFTISRVSGRMKKPLFYSIDCQYIIFSVKGVGNCMPV